MGGGKETLIYTLPSIYFAAKLMTSNLHIHPWNKKRNKGEHRAKGCPCVDKRWDSGVGGNRNPPPRKTNTRTHSVFFKGEKYNNCMCVCSTIPSLYSFLSDLNE